MEREKISFLRGIKDLMSADTLVLNKLQFQRNAQKRFQEIRQGKYTTHYYGHKISLIIIANMSFLCMVEVVVCLISDH